MRSFSTLALTTVITVAVLALGPGTTRAQSLFGSREFPPSYYGYPLDEYAGGYFGGGRYTHYHAYGRGVNIADFPPPAPAYPYPWYGPGKRMPVGSAAPVYLDHPAPVVIVVWVPPDAEVWVSGWKTTSTGAGREFWSPPLEPGVRHRYEIRARWAGADGKPVEQTQEVGIFAGDRAVVRFPAER